MSIVLVSKTESRTGPVIPFACPKCKKEVSGESQEAIERTSLFWILPILKFRNTWIACPACNTDFVLALPIDRLAELPAEARGALIVSGPPKRAKILAIAACLLFWVPLVGLLIAGAAVFVARGTKGWPKAIAWVSLLLASAITACIVLLMFK